MNYSNLWDNHIFWGIWLLLQEHWFSWNLLICRLNCVNQRSYLRPPADIECKVLNYDLMLLQLKEFKNNMSYYTNVEGLCQGWLYIKIFCSTVWIHVVFPSSFLSSENLFHLKMFSLYFPGYAFWSYLFFSTVGPFAYLVPLFWLYYLIIWTKESLLFWILENKRVNEEHWSGPHK